MNSTLRIIPIYLVCMVALASCDTTKSIGPSGDGGEVSIVVLPELTKSFEFREGLDDSMGFQFESSFRLPNRLVGFDSLAIRIFGDWTIGEYEIVRSYGSGAFSDTASMFLWVEVQLTTADSLDFCLDTSLRFPTEGEYSLLREFGGCCDGCFPVSEDLIGRELEIELFFKKSSSPQYETITEMPCEVIEVRIEAVNPRFLEE